MSLTLNDINTISLCIALLTGLYKINRIEITNRVIVYYIAYTLVNDILGILFQSLFNNNLILINFYVIINFVLLTTQFRLWKLFENARVTFWGLNIIVISIWVIESLLNRNLFVLNNYSWAVSAFLLVILSIQQINKILFKEKGIILINYKILVSLGVVLIHLLYCLIALFINFKFNASNAFYMSVLKLHTPISIAVNILFAYAILQMPERKKFLSIDS
ncbi:hypothetical protein [Solitalea canadensis]|uniref:YhhN-like protein n=1 Tax=Solitalea canadensis (strain ATCC 29591 / DSM 3403 / JCM 21819 / LMG 8368 / NBRC 15130 / NCIMB 12057 / USAM 9D) TaxID=929556 RepID=H8KU07_SOLCM|nr:hypothetical protein [Solitalea canadensis]AFD06987.1 hypothetical protein Solca_1927 [Solitalea canadensis DSM 3403]